MTLPAVAISERLDDSEDVDMRQPFLRMQRNISGGSMTLPYSRKFIQKG